MCPSAANGDNDAKSFALYQTHFSLSPNISQITLWNIYGMNNQYINRYSPTVDVRCEWVDAIRTVLASQVQILPFYIFLLFDLSLYSQDSRVNPNSLKEGYMYVYYSP